MLPQSPYGISKLAAFHLTKLYREAYGLYAANGILFNHESPRRGYNFVTKKITKEISRIIVGETNKIILGNIDAIRDWGFAKEYVQGIWAILQQPKPDDYVLATEEAHTTKEFVKESFDLLGLNYEDYLEISDQYKRPAEVPALLGNPAKAKRILGWNPQVKFKELVKMMVASDLKEKFEETGILPIESGVERSDEYYIEKAKEFLSKKRATKLL
jgi:GDPmannose 4,6-dehydratase